MKLLLNWARIWRYKLMKLWKSLESLVKI